LIPVILLHNNIVKRNDSSNQKTFANSTVYRRNVLTLDKNVLLTICR
jgi:hypothetical protein